MGRYTDALEGRREMHADAATRGHDMVWKRHQVDGKPTNSFDGECKHCGAQMGVGWSWTDSNHPNRDARKVECTGPGTKWQSDMQRELASERFRGHVSDFGQAVKDNYDRAWLHDQGIEASRKMTQRWAVLLDERGNWASVDGRPLAVPMPFLKSAHVSGNQIDIFHCPFCGSGDIVSRSDASIECGFCNSAFTVTVSPVYPAFPMSVNGQPYPWPGRPEDQMMMGDPNAADDGSGFGGQLIPGEAGGAGDEGDVGDGDGDGPPWAEGGSDDAAAEGDDSGSGDDDDKEAEVGGKKKPPFGKKKSVLVSGGVFGRYGYRTATGHTLPEDVFIQHLAIATAKDPNAMAAQVKERNEAAR